MEFRDLKKQYAVLKSQMDNAVLSVAESGAYISGDAVSELESRLAAYVGVNHCITCANGTDALSLALMAWNIGVGDAVFVPDFTFFATGEVVAFEGATPVFVDVDEKTFNMDPSRLEEAILKVREDGRLTPRAVIPVDLFGLPANYLKICEIARKYDLLVLEDGAQGFGGQINGRRACSFGDISTTSFFPAKPLGCYGDGGAIFTDNDDWAKLIRSYCVHGKGAYKYDNIRIGVNSRLDTIQAAILLVKLEAFEKYELSDVNRAAMQYTEILGSDWETPVIPNGFGSSWAQYTLRLNSEAEREKLQAELGAKGIPTMVYYPKPMHKQDAFNPQNSIAMPCPVTDRLCKTVLSVPMHPYLTSEQIAEVTKALEAACAKA